MTDGYTVLGPVDHDPFAQGATNDVRLPLTEPQAEMWSAAAMGPEANCAYNQCFALTLHGPLRPESLQAALDDVIARHEGLRAVIAPDGESQTLRSVMPVELRILDLSALDHEARERAIEDLLQREAHTPFDLAEGPLVRAFVARESADVHRFVLTVHHIVCDGWSSAVLFSDLGLLYAADRIGVPAHLPPASSYREYIAKQTGPDELGAAKIDEDYWAGLYPAGAPVMELPLTATRPANKTYASGREQLKIDTELCTALKRTGAKAGATFFATLLAAYEVLLYRLSNQSDLVIGIPFAGQPHLDNQHLVGHCVSTVPLRAALDPAAPFSDHLRAVSRGLANAQDHSRVTFGSLVRRLRIARDRSRTPLVATTFTMDKIGAPFDFGDVTVADVATPKRFSNFELVIVVQSGSGIVVECDYNTDLFDAPTLRRWLRHYETLLRGIVSQPDQPLHALPILEVDERKALATAGGEVSFGASGCLHERFELWAKRAPERVAVVCDGQALSYGLLDRRANALAVKLQALGVGRGVLVGLRTERSPSIVVGILGILKAGGAYVPLDPAYPKDRVDFMLADSEVKVVVTEAAFVDELRATQATLVEIDQEDRDEAAHAPESGVQAHDLAYVIYTSGSTGRPKGVLISHFNVTRLFDATARWFEFGETDVWTLFHSYAFDFSVWEMWGALLFGGRLVVVPYWVSRSPQAFRQLVIDEHVTVLNQTPSAFRQFIDADQALAPAAMALRYVVFGGEALQLQSLRPWMERYGDVQPRLINMYGITETTVHVTYRPIVLNDLDAGAGSVIGVPIPDLRLLVLDDHQQPVPIGVPGELYVGGAGVSRGYLKRPELTAQRFVPDPCAGTGHASLYRTGDLVRRLDNGDLEYLGRIDDQVKIRGFRIELGEIEAVLRQHPAIAHAIVIAREDTSTDKRLVAYIVAHDPAPPVDELRNHLRAHLPEYMVPAHVVPLAELPLTPNGKVDRKALPKPDYGRLESVRPSIAPRTPTEKTVAAIWAAVLGAPRVSVDDNFFDMGGHSIKAVQVIAALRSTFGVDAAMRHLFEQPTIAGLAGIVDVLAIAANREEPFASGQREEIEI